jgi:hypothetical protein
MDRIRASLRILAATTCLLGAHAHAQTSMQQCTLQSSYPNPVDADGNPIGALVKVSFRSRIGVVLDELPVEMRGRVADWLRAQPYDFWRSRIIKQIDLARYRLEHRNYYVAGQGALPLNDSSLWTVTLLGAPKRAPYTSGKTKSVLDAVSLDYQMETVLLTDINSPSTSTGHRLDKPGDTVQMDFGLPLDPTLLFQRTGRACYDEYGYPPNTVDPAGEPWFFYDDTCTAQNAQPLNSSAFACNYCHCDFPRPELDCVDALARKMGLVQAPFVFTRMAWSKAVADAYRFTGNGDQVLGPPAPNAADMIGWSRDLGNQRELYRYFAPNSCEANEECIGAAGGWRKLIMFYSTDVNNGTLDLHIGDVPYVTGNKLPDPIVNHGDYVFDQCHGHYHFEHYGTFSYVDDRGQDAAGDQQKRGFCLIDLVRLVNAEWSPLTIKYFDCKYQGITAGWADVYNIGIPCQWKDVTETPPGTYNLRATVNPDKIICEGALQCDADGNQIWDDTQFMTCSEGYTPQVCEVAQAARCQYPTDALGQSIDTTANNTDLAPSLHRDCGLTYVTDAVSPIGAGEEIGPLRDTEFSFYGNLKRPGDQLRGCTAGAPAALRCTVPAGSPPQVVRVCESSRALGCGTGCRYHEALTNVTIRPGETANVAFTCPSPRDNAAFGETGGAYSIYRAMAFGPDGARTGPDVTCVAH